MKQMIMGFVLFGLIFTAVSEKLSPESVRYFPQNVFYKEFKYTAGSTAGRDSIAIGGSDVWGPYMLSKDRTHPQATGLRLEVPNGAITAGDSVAVDFQITATANIADTISANWTVMDTVSSIGARSDYVVLDSIPGEAIWFKVINVDATSLKFSKPIRAMFIENLDFLTK